MRPPKRGLIVFQTSSSSRTASCAPLTILGVLAVSSELSVKWTTLWLAACTHRSPSPTHPCRRLNSLVPICSPGSSASAAPPNPRGCRSPSAARTHPREPIFRRGSLIRHVRNRRRRQRPAQRPRRMGLCSEVAGGGEIPKNRPALSDQIRPAPNSRFSAQIAPTYSGRRLNLLAAAQTKCLPGTLHHSGNRPAPPSEDIPLARRSAFARA